MRIVRPAQMAEIDRRAQEEFYIPGMVLMENAGIKGFLHYLELRHDAGDKELLFIAGGGNNGGDALVMARQACTLLPEARVRVVLVKRKLGELAGVHASSVEALGIPLAVWEDESERAHEFISSADVIFDGIAGTGLKGALRAPLDSLVKAVNEAAGREASELATAGYRREQADFSRGELRTVEVVAVDVPSGVGEGFREGMTAVCADLTLTMGLPKTTLYNLASRPFCGRIERICLGFPPQLLSNPEGSGELVEELRPRVEARRGYKGSRGHTAVFAGSVGTTGAASLSSRAAAAAGSGLVTLYCDNRLYPYFAGKAEGVMVKPLDLCDDALLASHRAIVAGPGWGKGRAELFTRLLESGLPGVADADGLRAANELPSGARFQGQWVLTPHPGEFSLISEISPEELFSDPIEAVREAAERLDAVVLLKAHVSYVAAPDGRYAVVDGMNPAMGTGGSGDVLAGTIGGLLAGGEAPFSAACRAARVHQSAGRRAAERSGWFTAEELPPIIARLMWHGESDA